MVTPDSEASYETEDGGDASEQEANHHPTDDDDEDGRMSEGQERNGVGQERAIVTCSIGQAVIKNVRRSTAIFKPARSLSEAIQLREGQTDGL